MSTNKVRRQRRQAARARQAELRRRRARRRRLLAVTVVAALVVAVAVVVSFAAGRADHNPAAVPGALPGLQTGPAPWGANTAGLADRLHDLGLPPLSPVEATVVHIHQHLDLYVDGRKVPLATGIGIDPAVGYSPLHTHDSSGVIHVESPTVRTYTLGEFFGVWGVRFTPTCLGGYCAGGGRQLRVYVGGKPYRGDPTTLVLTPHQEIVVAYGTPAQLPSPIPSAYQFPPGL
jgi:hypothetical protein